jgi:hypothetical protein
MYLYKLQRSKIMQSANPSNSVPAKIPRVAVYLQEEVKAELDRLAFLERRSASQMGAILIEEGIARAKADGRLRAEQEVEFDSNPDSK